MTHDEWLLVIIGNAVYLMWWAENAWFRAFVYPGSGR